MIADEHYLKWILIASDAAFMDTFISLYGITLSFGYGQLCQEGI
jgi:hypothetical protein